jgi:hypothetical protein
MTHLKSTFPELPGQLRGCEGRSESSSEEITGAQCQEDWRTMQGEAIFA